MNGLTVYLWLRRIPDEEHNDNRSASIRRGAERVAAELSKVLSEDYNVTIVTFYPYEQYEYKGELICLNYGDYGSKSYFGRAIIVLKRILAVRKLKKDKGIDISISHMPDADLVNVLSHRRERLIGEIHHNPYTETIKGGWHYHLRKAVLRRFDKVVTPSEGAKRAAIDYYNLQKEGIQAIYNPCNIDTASSVQSGSALLEKYGVKDSDLYSYFPHTKEG